MTNIEEETLVLSQKINSIMEEIILKYKITVSEALIFASSFFLHAFHSSFDHKLITDEIIKDEFLLFKEKFNIYLYEYMPQTIFILNSIKENGK